MENRGKRWTKDEDVKLIEEIKKGRSLEDVAKDLKRSLKSIQCRLRLIVYNNIGNKEETDKMLEIDNKFLKNAIEDSQKENLDKESFVKGIGKMDDSADGLNFKKEEIFEKFSALESRISNLESLIANLLTEIKKLRTIAFEDDEELVLL